MSRVQRHSRFLSRPGGIGMTIGGWMSSAWRWLREVSGDAAYERYLTRAASARVTLSEPDGRAKGAPSLLTPAEFYRRRVEHKYSRPCRCC